KAVVVVVLQPQQALEVMIVIGQQEPVDGIEQAVGGGLDRHRGPPEGGEVGFLLVGADGVAAGQVGLIDQQRLARSAFGGVAHQVGGPAHAVAVPVGGAQV